MYSRTTGGGLIGLAVVLVVIGAILRFAVTVTTSGFNIHKVGDILLVVGIILAVLSITLIAMSSRRRVTTRTDIRATPGGQQRVEDRQDWGGDPYYRNGPGKQPLAAASLAGAATRSCRPGPARPDNADGAPMNRARHFTFRIGRRRGRDDSGPAGLAIAIRTAWTARAVIRRAERLTRSAAAPRATRARRQPARPVLPSRRPLSPRPVVPPRD
jgi:hypothetical protein